MSNKAIKRKIVSVIILCCIVLSIPLSVIAEHKDYKTADIVDTIQAVVEWKKYENKSKNGNLFDSNFLSNVGNSATDWYAIAFGRLGTKDDYSSYNAMLKNVVSERYSSEGKLDSQKATEWHRISLAVLALGGDPTNMGTDVNGNVIDLISDGTYNRANTVSLGSQGINGYIWGLITLDAMRYKVPENAADSRDSIIKKILENQLSDGGFALDRKSSDVDITAMGLTALAPYYNSEQKYSIGGKNKKVRDSVNEAINYLSSVQNSHGDFLSWGSLNVESTAQVMVALCSLGIDPINDARFTKNGNNILDGIMKYNLPNGAFTHSFDEDKDNPSASPGKANSMASEQALYALVSLYRFQGGLRSLYDFRTEISDKEKTIIKTLEKDINALKGNGSAIEVKELFKTYMSVPITERSYVKNYASLASTMESLNIENTSEYLSAFMNENKNGNGTVIDIINMKAISSNMVFNEQDLSEYKNLPKVLTTEDYTSVVRLYDKLLSAQNNEEYKNILDDLKEKKMQIEIIKAEIEDINTKILENLYPFNSIGYKDKSMVDTILSRVNKLSDYDKMQILGYEDVVRANVKLKGQKRAWIITVVICMVIVIMSIIVFIRFKKRRKEKQQGKMIFEDSDNDDD